MKQTDETLDPKVNATGSNPTPPPPPPPESEPEAPEAPEPLVEIDPEVLNRHLTDVTPVTVELSEDLDVVFLTSLHPPAKHCEVHLRTPRGPQFFPIPLQQGDRADVGTNGLTAEDFAAIMHVRDQIVGAVLGTQAESDAKE